MKEVLKGSLEGIKVIDFSTLLPGPLASLFLPETGAEVIKIEKPGVGDEIRLSNPQWGEQSVSFSLLNRGKKSLSLDLKDPKNLKILIPILKEADIIIEQFRPGVMKRLGLDYESVKKINSKIVYGSISGYGNEGPWKDLPGQDLLAQSRSGLVWLNGNGGEAPTPMGLAAADMLAGHYMVEGILSALIKSLKTGEGSLVETSLMEALLDFQFEVLTTYLNDGNRKPVRSSYNNAHAYLSAPYGIYKTKDSFIAIAMTPVPALGELLGLKTIIKFTDQKEWFTKRDDIKRLIGEWLINETTDHWLGILQPADIWCAEVLEWDKMIENEGFKVLDMLQRIKRSDGLDIETLRCPIRINNEIFKSEIAAPLVGQHNEEITKEYNL